MRRVVFLTGLALAVGALLPASAQPAAGGSDLPVRGALSGLSTTDFATGHVHSDATGVMSHFGLTTTVQDLQVVGVVGGTFYLSGTWTNTAANGDEMSGTSTATSTTVDGVNFTFLGTYISTGGTGRFADATLTLEVTGTSTRLSLDGTVATAFDEVTGVGTLSY
jgi:hypothetical protein